MVASTPVFVSICGKTSTPTQPRAPPINTGSQRGGRAQTSRVTIATAAPAQTTASTEIRHPPESTSSPTGVYEAAIIT